MLLSLALLVVTTDVSAEMSTDLRLMPPALEGARANFEDSAIVPMAEDEPAPVETENAAIPEPTTLALMGFGLAGAALRKRFMA